MTNKHKRRSLSVLQIPACSMESGPDVLWVSHGGKWWLEGSSRGGPMCSSSHAAVLVTRRPCPLNLRPCGAPLVGMPADWLPHSPFISCLLLKRFFSFWETGRRVSQRLPVFLFLRRSRQLHMNYGCLLDLHEIHNCYPQL